MKWEETVASEARYNGIAELIFDGLDIIYDKSEADYQGSVEVFAVEESDGWRNREPVFLHLEYSYGSCSGCDEWESRNLSDTEILKEMINEHVSFIKGTEAVEKYPCNKELRSAINEWLETNKKE